MYIEPSKWGYSLYTDDDGRPQEDRLVASCADEGMMHHGKLRDMIGWALYELGGVIRYVKKSYDRYNVTELMESAEESAEWRGHTMGGWQIDEFWLTPYCECQVCGAYMSVDARPAPNGIDISGEAVAINCKEA